ncbi:MAG: hypothetical protein AAFQ81_14525 [Pseudomonadota bacterium]
MRHLANEHTGSSLIGRPARSAVPNSPGLGVASLAAAVAVHVAALALMTGEGEERLKPVAAAPAQAMLSVMALTAEPAARWHTPGLSTAAPGAGDLAPALAQRKQAAGAVAIPAAPAQPAAEPLNVAALEAGLPPIIPAPIGAARPASPSSPERGLGVALASHNGADAAPQAGEPAGLVIASLGNPGSPRAGLAPQRPDLTPLPRVRPADLLASAARPARGGPPTSPLLSRARLVIHHTPTKADAAINLAARLVAAGGAQVLTREVGFQIGSAQLRYYHPTDAALTRLVARAAGGGFELRDFTAYEPAPSYGTVEIWLPSSMSG